MKLQKKKQYDDILKTLFQLFQRREVEIPLQFYHLGLDACAKENKFIEAKEMFTKLRSQVSQLKKVSI